MAKRRRLRSKEDSVKTKLFNLDELIDSIPIDVDIPVVDECSGPKRPTTEIHASSSVNLLTKPLNIVQIPSRQRRRLTTIKKKVSHLDPLDDKLFLKHHQRAEKSEKKMTNIEKERVFTEYDYYLHCLEQLKTVCQDYEASMVPNQQMMLRITEPFTTIDDPNDRQEVLMKIQLLIGEITMFTRAFERLRKLELKLKTLHNNFYHQIDNPEDSDTEEEAHMDVKRLRETRFYRRLKHGPLIKIRFLDGTVLVKDAISPPKVINF
ncbi:hypothetical protein LJB42_002075 [Komagataella kurtzmanii]|nr:hypothetical protein LJB42_002075 [Komagataella kurtzmanii]